MGIREWLKNQSGSGTISADDPRVTSLVDALASQVTIQSPGNSEFRRVDSTIATAEELGSLHRKFPENPELHYIYAAALQQNLLGEQAAKVLRDCVQRHPEFWVAALTLKRNGLPVWNPFKCPDFDPAKTQTVHDAINRILTKTLVLTTRRGLLPRSVVFHRDEGDELAVSKLETCEIKFATTISSVRDPQVVAINICIMDDPRNPFRTEVLACPFGPWSDEHRFAYEIFVRQEDFDFVVVDRTGRVKYRRLVKPSSRMRAAHAELAQMFDRTEGHDIPTSTHIQAIRRHTSMVDPNSIVY